MDYHLLTLKNYDARLKAPAWSFQKLQHDPEAQSLWSNREHKSLWSTIWDVEKTSLNGQNLEELRKRFFQRQWSKKCQI